MPSKLGWSAFVPCASARWAVANAPSKRNPKTNRKLLCPFLDSRALQQIHHSVVPFVARVLVDLLVGARHRNCGCPLFGERRRIVNREFVSDRVGVDAGETLDEMQP